MALAMDARGYGTNLNRGTYKKFEFKTLDGVFIFTILLISASLVVL